MAHFEKSIDSDTLKLSLGYVAGTKYRYSRTFLIIRYGTTYQVVRAEGQTRILQGLLIGSMMHGSMKMDRLQDSKVMSRPKVVGRR